MGLNVKVGKGGHGLEVYDEEGKYAEEFSFELEGQQIKGYDDFRAFYFTQLASQSEGAFSASDLETLYNQDADTKAQFDEQLEPEYERMLTEAVNDHNAKQVWDSPEETAKHLHELFVPNLVSNLLENHILESNKSSVADHYKVDTFAACMQMSRYKQNRSNPVSREEYSAEMSANQASGGCSSSTSVSDFRKYIENAVQGQKSIPILRNISGVAHEDQKNILESFYDENSPRNSCLAHSDAVNCSFLGSVIYFSTGGYSYSGGWGSLSINGFVRMNDKLRLLECPLRWGEAGEYSCNQSIPEVLRFRQAVKADADFDNRMLSQLTANGQMEEADARVIISKLHHKINSDPGFCAILMGYDAIYGISYHFDLLNLGIAHIVKR